MFKSLAAPIVQEESEELIQLINPEQEMDIKPEEIYRLKIRYSFRAW
jgi:ATP-dependent Lon protease